MLKFRPSAKIVISLSFLSLFILLNYWIINHNGPVGMISEFTISNFGYWSSTLSMGLPVAIGLLLFLAVCAGLLIKRQIVYYDSSGTERKIDGETLKELSRIFVQRMQLFKYALVLIVVGAELTAFDVIQNMELAKINKVPVKCSFFDIQNNSCLSRYVVLALDEPPGQRAYFTAEKSRRYVHYYRPQGVANVFLMEESFGREAPRFLSLREIKGVVKKMDPSDELLIRSEYKDLPDDVLVIDPELDPNSISWVMTVIASLMLCAGLILFYRKTRFVK